MLCAQQNQILLFAQTDFIQSQGRDANSHCAMQIGRCVCREHAMFTLIVSFAQVKKIIILKLKKPTSERKAYHVQFKKWFLLFLGSLFMRVT